MIPRVPGHFLSCNGLLQWFNILIFIIGAPLQYVWHGAGAHVATRKLFSLNQKTVSTQPSTQKQYTHRNLQDRIGTYNGTTYSNEREKRIVNQEESWKANGYIPSRQPRRSTFLHTATTKPVFYPAGDHSLHVKIPETNVLIRSPHRYRSYRTIPESYRTGVRKKDKNEVIKKRWHPCAIPRKLTVTAQKK